LPRTRRSELLAQQSFLLDTRQIVALAFSPSGRFERLFVLGQVLFGEFTAPDHFR
jgi:hypothetical protein